MILKNNLYRIKEQNSETKSFSLELIPNCTIYKAHFPEQPITPGVCIIQIASELLAHLFQFEVELLTVSNAKFLAVINPEETPEVRYTFNKVFFDEGKTSVKVSVLVSNKETLFTKLSLAYKIK